MNCSELKTEEPCVIDSACCPCCLCKKSINTDKPMFGAAPVDEHGKFRRVLVSECAALWIAGVAPDRSA